MTGSSGTPLHVYPIMFLAGKGEFFEQGDASASVSGWLFYSQDSWHLPLFHTGRMNYPEGEHIIFTDSIPAAAVIVKPFVRWLPKGFHYMGLWHAVALIFQAVSATFLIRALGFRSLLACLAATFFAVTWPLLAWRVGHTALMAHGLILCSLGFYFSGRRGTWSSGASTSALIIVSAMGLMVFPHLALSCYAIFLAFLLDQAIAGEGWTRQMVRLVISVVILAVISAALGYFGSSSVIGGYGVLSMNLMAPFVGGSLWGGFVDATGGQYEGYNYLGAGVLLLFCFVVTAQWKWLIALPRRYPALTLLLVVFTVFALSTPVYWGTHRVFEYHVPSFLHPFTGALRSSGRFFWAVGYVILFTVLAGTLRKGSFFSVCILFVAAILQWADTGVLRERVYANASPPSLGDLVQWENILHDVDDICVYPVWGCPTLSRPLSRHILFFQRLAARYGKVINTCYSARPHLELCKSKNDFFEQDFTGRRLYVMPADHDGYVPSGFQTALQRGECVECQAGAAVTCKPGASREDWIASGLEVRPVASDRFVVKPYVPGTRLSFNQSEVKQYLRIGWSSQESWGIWTDGPRAELDLPLDEPVHGECRLVLECRLFPFPPEKQRVRVMLNGTRIGDIGPDVKGENAALAFNGKLLKQANTIAFHIERPVSPLESGMSDDYRKLGLGLMSLQIVNTSLHTR